jgi:Protein of unknown function (DUF4231)
MTDPSPSSGSLPSGSMGAWGEVLRRLPLSEPSVEVATRRIAAKAVSLERRVWRLSCVYRAAKLVVTLGALLTPAVSGLDSPTGRSDAVFWLIWSLGLGTAASNALISLFALDRKYFCLKERLARLESEAWLFVGLSGKYKKGGGHQELFSSFLENCEHLLHSFPDHSNRPRHSSGSGGGSEAEAPEGASPLGTEAPSSQRQEPWAPGRG